MLGLLTVRLYIRESRSLKDKRQVIRSILDRLRSQFNVSASETETQDDHQQSTISVAAVAPEADIVRGVLQGIQEALRKHPIAEYLGGEIQIGNEVV